jgi:hypothetical protein
MEKRLMLALVLITAVIAALALGFAHAGGASAHRGVDDPQHLYDW